MMTTFLLVGFSDYFTRSRLRGGESGGKIESGFGVICGAVDGNNR